MVSRLADQIRNSDGTNLVVPPAGTRSYTEYWKSGFYRIALEANIPVVCGYLDYDRKVAGLGLTFELSGEVKEDMARIREFYEPLVGKYPDKKSRILLKEEE
jgi:1-acyl-sn-glycerol-3-phosphate acyltransferase